MTMEDCVIGIGGMSCQGCVKNVTGVLQALPGVEQVSVSLEDGQARLVFDPLKSSFPQFKAAIEDAGFDVL
jgi:copper chaperone